MLIFFGPSSPPITVETGTLVLVVLTAILLFSPVPHVIGSIIKYAHRHWTTAAVISSEIDLLTHRFPAIISWIGTFGEGGILDLQSELEVLRGNRLGYVLMVRIPSPNIDMVWRCLFLMEEQKRLQSEMRFPHWRSQEARDQWVKACAELTALKADIGVSVMFGPNKTGISDMMQVMWNTVIREIQETERKPSVVRETEHKPLVVQNLPVNPSEEDQPEVTNEEKGRDLEATHEKRDRNLRATGVRQGYVDLEKEPSPPHSSSLGASPDLAPQDPPHVGPVPIFNWSEGSSTR